MNRSVFGMRLPRIALALVLASILAPASSAQDFMLPLEFGQGLLLRDGADPYKAALRIQPTFGFRDRKIRLGPTVALAYTNPDFALQAGARASAQVAGVQALGVFALRVHLALEGLWERSDLLGAANRGLVGPALVVDLGGLGRVGFRASHDYLRDEWIVGTFLALDLTIFRSEPEI